MVSVPLIGSLVGSGVTSIPDVTSGTVVLGASVGTTLPVGGNLVLGSRNEVRSGEPLSDFSGREAVVGITGETVTGLETSATADVTSVGTGRILVRMLVGMISAEPVVSGSVEGAAETVCSEPLGEAEVGWLFTGAEDSSGDVVLTSGWLGKTELRRVSAGSRIPSLEVPPVLGAAVVSSAGGLKVGRV